MQVQLPALDRCLALPPRQVLDQEQHVVLVQSRAPGKDLPLELDPKQFQALGQEQQQVLGQKVRLPPGLLLAATSVVGP